jgi:hypothetical protein
MEDISVVGLPSAKKRLMLLLILLPAGIWTEISAEAFLSGLPKKIFHGERRVFGCFPGVSGGGPEKSARFLMVICWCNCGERRA